MHKTTPITQEKNMEDFCKFLLSLLSFFLLLSHGSLATARDHFPNEQQEGSQPQVYIVHVQPQEMTTFATGADDKKAYYKSFLPVTAASTGESPMVYMYDKVISGFAARLTALDLDDMSKKDGFLAAYPSRTHSLQTTHTPRFLGLNIQNGIWNQSYNGEGIIVGVIDGGVFPKHPSFSGEGMPKPPSKWKGRCDFDSSLCNNKLIGARAFLNGTTDMSPLDEEGHGTHTASTAAGAAVAGAEVLGNAMGMASGMAPRAHLSIYKVCSTVERCLDFDILAAMDTAVSDGVDVLSISLVGGSFPFFQDGLTVGAFGAIEHGVFVSCAAGNSGPFASSLSNEAPWILTVAASTMDRSIISTVQLSNGMSYDGESLNQSQSFASGSYPLVYAGASGNTDAAFCGNTSFDGFDLRGKIVLCERGGDIARIEKGVNVQTAGGFGMILMNQVADGFSTIADPHVLPASHVSYSDGLMIKTYIRYSTLNATASFSFKGTEIGTSPAPAITSFSSRGPSIASPGILKPDITGPGVSVLAAWPSLASNPSQVIFNIISGTSMSTPHLSGIAALIKAAHPDWSPAAIKSAMMTTADIMDRSGIKPIVDERLFPANLFAVGAGHVNPDKASDPGLVYDLKPDDYIPYLCGLGYNSTQVGVILRRRIDCSSIKTITEGELNYPSFSVAFIDGKTSITFERTVKNVGEAESTFCVKVDVPGGVYVTVQPNELRFTKTNQEMKFKVTFNKSNISDTVRYSQGYLNWISGKHTVRSPISVAF